MMGRVKDEMFLGSETEAEILLSSDPAYKEWSDERERESKDLEQRKKCL